MYKSSNGPFPDSYPSWFWEHIAGTLAVEPVNSLHISLSVSISHQTEGTKRNEIKCDMVSHIKRGKQTPVRNSWVTLIAQETSIYFKLFYLFFPLFCFFVFLPEWTFLKCHAGVHLLVTWSNRRNVAVWCLTFDTSFRQIRQMWSGRRNNSHQILHCDRTKCNQHWF